MRRSLMLLLVAAAALALAPPAMAGSFQQLYRDYRDDGRINGCNYSDAQLRGGQGDLPPDVEQYAPSLAEQIAAARDQRCGGGGGSGQGEDPGDSASAKASKAAANAAKPDKADVPEPPKPREVAPRLASVRGPQVSEAAALDDASEPAWLLVLAGVVAVLVAAVLVARRYGVRGVGAATDEAGARAADTAAEFKDWIRIGR